MSTAAKVAQAKEAHPERYCPEPRCLWRTGGGRCPRHPVKLLSPAAQVRFTADGYAGLWKAGDIADDLGWESTLPESDPDFVPVRLLRLRGEVLNLSDPFGRGLITPVTSAVLADDAESQSVERHNSYAWIKPDADACALCGRKEFATPVDGFMVRECTDCGRLACEDCVDVDCDSDGEGYFVTGWTCKGAARIDCERITESQRIAELTEREIVALEAHCEVVKRHQIERRVDGRPTACWTGFCWAFNPSYARAYTEAERTESLRLHVAGEPNGFPEGGSWTVLDSAPSIECHECQSRLSFHCTPRELAEIAHVASWMVFNKEPLCFSCQSDNGTVSDDDARADQAYDEWKDGE